MINSPTSDATSTAKTYRVDRAFDNHWLTLGGKFFEELRAYLVGILEPLNLLMTEKRNLHTPEIGKQCTRCSEL